MILFFFLECIKHFWAERVSRLIELKSRDSVSRLTAQELRSPAEDSCDVAAWEEQAFLSHGALLAKSCQAAMELARHSQESQRAAYLYGKHLSLGHKVSLAVETTSLETPDL